MKKLLTMALLALCATSAMAQKYMKVEYKNGSVLNVPLQYIDKVTPTTHNDPVIENITTGMLNVGDLVTVTGKHLDMITSIGSVSSFDSQTETKITFALPKTWSPSDYLPYTYVGTAIGREGSSNQTMFSSCIIDAPLGVKEFRISTVKLAASGTPVSVTDTISVAKGDVYLDIEGECIDQIDEVRISDNDYGFTPLPAEYWENGLTDNHMTLRVPTCLADGKLEFIFGKLNDGSYRMVRYGYVMNEMPVFEFVEYLPNYSILYNCDNIEAWESYPGFGATVLEYENIPTSGNSDPRSWPWLGRDYDDEHPGYCYLTLQSTDEGYVRIKNKFGSYTWLYYKYEEPDPKPDPTPDPTPDPGPDIDEFDVVGKVVWTGDFACDNWYSSGYFMSDGGAELQGAGAQAGDVLHFYVNCTDASGSWELSISEGHFWTPEFQFLDHKTWDLAAHGNSIDLKLTDEILQAAYNAQGWGGSFVLNGDNIVVKAVSLEKAK